MLLWSLDTQNTETNGGEQLLPTQHQTLESVLENFADVFQELIELPLVRDRTHAILLQQGVTAVNVQPYRYARCQTNEIERLVQEMLVAGIIQPSSSPFSSPVILVKKKDGSWRFFVDYRALNKLPYQISTIFLLLMSYLLN